MGVLLHIQAQARFPVIRIWAMALVAAIREQRQDLAVEVDRRQVLSDCHRSEHESQAHGRRQEARLLLVSSAVHTPSLTQA